MNEMNESLSRLEENALYFLRYFADASATSECGTIENVQYTYGGYSSFLVNNAIGGNPRSPLFFDTALQLVKYYVAKNASFCWWLRASGDEASFCRIMEKFGFYDSMPIVCMKKTRETVPAVISDDFRIVRVSDAASFALFTRVYTASLAHDDLQDVRAYYEDISHIRPYNDGDMTFFVGLVGDIPVSICTSICTNTTATVYDVITLPSWRHHGYATNMVETAFSFARSKGIMEQMLFANRPVQSLYEHIGFEPFDLYYIFHNNRFMQSLNEKQ